MTLDCNCKGIRQIHTQAALQWEPETPEELYALALAEKKADPKARITGLEDKNGDRYNCGRCSHIFDAAVKQDTSSPRVFPIIMMGTISKPPSALETHIGRCGNDCNTCAPAVQTSGCAPATL